MTAFTLEYDVDARIDLLAPACRLDVNLDEPILSISNLDDFATVYATFYSNGKPLGVSVLPINSGKCLAEDIETASESHQQQQQRTELEKLIKIDKTNTRDLSNITVSVIIPTCDRPEKLLKCLGGVLEQTHTPDRIIVVDNAPGKGDVKALLAKQFPAVEYLECHIKGSSAARNAGAEHSDSEFLAFLDDDVSPSKTWLESFCCSIVLDNRVGLISGLVFPKVLDSEAQVLMEALGGFNGGFRPKWVLPATANKGMALQYLDFPYLGVGCNFLVRAAVMTELGGFDQTIGAGLGIDGEDFDLFSRVVDAGYVLSYESSAVVYHSHRETNQEFEVQYLRSAWSVGFLWGRMAQYQPRLRSSANSLFRKYLRLLTKDSIHAYVEKDIVSGEFRRKKLSKFIAGYFKGRFSNNSNKLPLWRRAATPDASEKSASRVKVLQLDLSRRIPVNFTYADYDAIEFQLFCGETYITSIRMPIVEATVNYRQLLSEVPDVVTESLIKNLRSRDPAVAPVYCPEYGQLVDTRIGHIPFAREMCWRPSVTVVVPTRNRPDDLEDCLWRISRQDYDGNMEILVVDNDRKSGLTQNVVKNFEACTYLYCDKPGSSATRNVGFAKATGEIVIITDDDVLVPPGWVRNMVQKFRRQDVWMVNGSVLPSQLSTTAELGFEGIGGFPLKNNIEMTGSSFRAKYFFPLFSLGVSANMAFRRHILSNPKIGGMSEVLGAGLLTSGGEDPELIYRVLNEGHTVIADPSIWVHHRHRSSEKALIRQLYGYGKSGPAFFIHLLIEQRDFRMIGWLLIQPFLLLRLIVISEVKYKKYWLAEFVGYFIGAPAYFWARIRDRRYDKKIELMKRADSEI